MTSAINPATIDGAYPVAGQDNNSQGFRDNFTNTRTNFAYAAAEITDLQNKVVLKQALTGTTLNNDMLGSILYNAQFQDIGQTKVSLGTLSGTVTVEYTNGPVQTVITSGPINIAVQNWPTSGISGTVEVEVTVVDVAHTVTLTSLGTWVNASGIQGCVVSGATAVITLAATGVYTFILSSTNAGSTITISEVNKLIQPFNSTSEDLAAGTAASLATTSSYFTTVTSESGTLAAGVPGQIKTFAMYGDGGDMVIIVTNAGWKSSGTGTITFDTIGDACTLQYLNSKWFCIGNNGAVFG
jgi:hypothetical protein